MHARLSRLAGLAPERVQEALREFKEDQLPVLEQQPGFNGIFVLLDEDAGRVAAVSFWESKEQMRASSEVADRARETAMATGGVSREPIVDEYEVVIDNIPATAG